MRSLNVGVIGLGTVGGGTIEVFQRNQKEIYRRSGREIKIIAACAKNIKKKRAFNTDHLHLGNDPYSIIDNPNIDIVCELINDAVIAREFVLAAIARGKHVVTANKGLIAKYGNEIFAAAQEEGATVAYEAAVGGGIPIIKSLREGFAANHIKMVAGIINGTTNYILTEMQQNKREFQAVLEQAQKLGYAEASPRLDVEGIDAAHKLSILAAIAYGMPIQFSRVYIEGIASITPADIDHADELNYRIKHLAIAKKSEQGIELRVHPVLIAKRHLLANVNGVMNAVLVIGDAVGSTIAYGAGAGAEATASAVIADIIDVARNIDVESTQRIPHLAFQPESLAKIAISPLENIETAYYLRMDVSNEPGVLAVITDILGQSGINIETILQKAPSISNGHVPVIALTHATQESKMNAVIRQIENISSLHGKVQKIRVENFSG